MANKVERRFLTDVTAQASAAISADAFSAGAQTALSAADSGNADGAQELEFTLDVTAAPATAAEAEIYVSHSRNNSDYNAEYLLKTISVATSVDTYDAGVIVFPRQYTKARIKAIDYGFTATLYCTPVVPEVQ